MKQALLSFFLMSALIFTPALAYAQSGGLVPCGPKGQTVQGQESPDGCTLKDLFNLLVRIYNFLLGMAGIVAFGLLVYGGVQMLLFSVDEDKVKSGKSTVTQALIGLAIIALAYIIVNTLLLALGVTGGAGGFFSGAKFFGN
jgi:hypothetical protein